jgi:hypothetical protein
MSAKPSFTVRVLCILWPSFMMAGVLEMLVFSLVEPGTLLWFGADPIEWSTTAIYSAAFMLFWLVISTASALTHLLTTLPDEPVGIRRRGPSV